jgi:hypothetical protein
LEKVSYKNGLFQKIMHDGKQETIFLFSFLILATLLKYRESKLEGIANDLAFKLIFGYF